MVAVHRGRPVRHAPPGMHFPSSRFIFFAVAGALALGLSLLAGNALTGRVRVGARYAGALAVVGILFPAVREIDDYARAVDVTKAMIAIAAAGACFYEQHRAGMQRPVAERWKRFAGLMLGIVAVSAYFKGGISAPRGSTTGTISSTTTWGRSFSPMGYDGLYAARRRRGRDRHGLVPQRGRDRHGQGAPRHEGRGEPPRLEDPELGGDNLLMPVGEVLAHPEVCKATFRPRGGSAFKADVKFFRIASDKEYWKTMQNDHGYNPPPVWTLGGIPWRTCTRRRRASSSSWGRSRHGAARGDARRALLGVRVARVRGSDDFFWGTSGDGGSSWTLGAFLRQDWLFLFVLAACLTRKGWHAARRGLSTRRCCASSPGSRWQVGSSSRAPTSSSPGRSAGRSGGRWPAASSRRRCPDPAERRRRRGRTRTGTSPSTPSRCTTGRRSPTTWACACSRPEAPLRDPLRSASAPGRGERPR